MTKKHYIMLACFLLSFLLITNPARTAVITIQALQFGEFLIRNNDAVHTLTINTNGTHSNSAGFVELSPPQEGIYDITGLPASMVITSIDVTQLQPLTGGANTFPLSAFQTSFTGTDASGVARIIVGATASTTGSGIPYTNQTYSGQLQLQINF